MGSMPRLKIKDDLHYRKGSTNESRNCRYCSNFMRDAIYDGFAGVGKYSMKWPGRCKLIVNGFGSGTGIRYRVLSDHTCDAQVLDEELLERGISGGRRLLVGDQSPSRGG